MEVYNGTSLAHVRQEEEEAFCVLEDYLSAEGGYWLDNDVWTVCSGKFMERGISTGARKRGSIVDFSGIAPYHIKTELKYHALRSMTMKTIAAATYAQNYKEAAGELGRIAAARQAASITGMELLPEELDGKGYSEFRKSAILFILNGAKDFLTEVYDVREETSKDVWQAGKVPGARLSAAQRRLGGTLDFSGIPAYYRETVKRYMRRLVVKRSWPHCSEMLRYVRTFLLLFYRNGYGDGFLKDLSRADIENYLEWCAEEYQGDNATYASKAVSFVRQFLDYIQIAEYDQAPEKDIYRLIYDDDVPKRERLEDTFEKVKYIPEPVRMQLDANVSAIEPAEMQPIYILLRESGWRGTDILDLRYDTCIDYVWDKDEGKYVPYLCGEITKTGIPMLKIPIRDETARLVEELKKEAEAKSTEENNPDRYLFNTYEGVSMGLPYSKAAFAKAVNEMIRKKGILDANGGLYHFRTHSLRHTRASEYAEQGMPVGIIQRMLGHCSLQMTLHYAKISENVLYKKWKETEKLGTLHLGAAPPEKGRPGNTHQEVCYEKVCGNLDAVRVPLGVCFKPSKIPCKTQLRHCLECASFCSTRINESEYREEIRRVGELVALGKRLGRQEWIDKNQEYLDLLIKMHDRICEEGIIHKNGALREVENA